MAFSPYGGKPLALDYLFEVTAGRVPGSETGFIISSNPSIGSSASETMWDYGGNYTYLTADTTLYVSSDNAADTGILVAVSGLDDNYDRITTTAVLNGQAQVALSAQMFRVFTVATATSSQPIGTVYLAESDTLTGGVPDTPSKVKGTIPLTTDSDGNIIDTGTVYASDNISHLGLYTVPAGYTIYSQNIYAGSAKNTNIKVGARVRFFGGAWLNRNPTLIYQSNARLEFDLPIPLPEKTDFEFRAVAGSDGSAAHIQFSFVLEKNK